MTEAIPKTAIFEQAPMHEIAPWSLANNPARALIYLVLAAEAGNHTPAMLTERLHMRQDTSSAWQLTQAECNACESHCSKVLEPLGLIKKTTVLDNFSRPSTAYRASNIDQEYRIAHAGSNLDWELQFPSISSVAIVGELSVDNLVHAEPLVNMGIYQQLARYKYGRTAQEIARAIDAPSRNIHECLKLLFDRGVIVKSSLHHFAGRRLNLEVHDPIYDRRLVHQLTPQARAIYDTASSLRSSGKTMVDAVDFIEKIVSEYPSISPQTVGEILNDSASKVSFTDIQKPGDKHTPYAIAAEMQPIIADLMLRQERLREDPEYVKNSAKRAKEIINDPSAVTFLMNKARLLAKAEEHLIKWPPTPEARLRIRLASLTLQRLPITKGWIINAGCKDSDLELFFPIGSQGPSKENIEQAKAICAACPVMYSCLQWSLDSGQKEGIFGGKTPAERIEYRSKPRIAELQTAVDNPMTNQALATALDKLALAPPPMDLG